MNQQTIWDAEDDAQSWREARRLTQALATAREREASARSAYAEAVRVRKAAEVEREAWFERQSKPLPLFDGYTPRPEPTPRPVKKPTAPPPAEGADLFAGEAAPAPPPMSEASAGPETLSWRDASHLLSLAKTWDLPAVQKWRKVLAKSGTYLAEVRVLDQEIALRELPPAPPPEEEKRTTGAERRGASPGIMAQIAEAKERHPGMLLLFREPDHYWLPDDDQAAQAERHGVPRRFPLLDLETHLRTLLKAKLRVAICDKVEDGKAPAGAKVERVVTPGEVEENETARWMREVRDPAQAASAGERVIKVKGARAAYQLAPIAEGEREGEWAVSCKLEYEGGDKSSARAPWRPFATRAEALDYFLAQARRHFAPRPMTDVQKKAQAAMLKALADPFVEPPLVARTAGAETVEQARQETAPPTEDGKRMVVLGGGCGLLGRPTPIEAPAPEEPPLLIDTVDTEPDVDEYKAPLSSLGNLSSLEQSVLARHEMVTVGDLLEYLECEEGGLEERLRKLGQGDPLRELPRSGLRGLTDLVRAYCKRHGLTCPGADEQPAVDVTAAKCWLPSPLPPFQVWSNPPAVRQAHQELLAYPDWWGRGDDLTAVEERAQVEHRLRGIPEAPVDKEKRVQIVAWRMRQRANDIQPRWGEWCEFEVNPEPDQVVKVLYRPKRPGDVGRDSWDLHGPAASETGFRHHYADRSPIMTLREQTLYMLREMAKPSKPTRSPSPDAPPAKTAKPEVYAYEMDVTIRGVGGSSVKKVCYVAKTEAAARKKALLAIANAESVEVTDTLTREQHQRTYGTRRKS